MNYIYYLDLFGTSVFAVSGAILATRKNMDVFGVIVVGFVTAIGGGTLRDVLIGRTPAFWLSDKNYIVLILIASLLTFSFAAKILRVKNVLRMADAIGLGTFTIIGIKIGLDGGLSNIFAIIMGMMTAAFGGVIRDVLCREIPLILNREIYATASLAGGIVFFSDAGPRTAGEHDNNHFDFYDNSHTRPLPEIRLEFTKKRSTWLGLFT